jgi:hypothetical protein
VHVPQFKTPPQPFEMDPQFFPCAAQVVGVHGFARAACDVDATDSLSCGSPAVHATRAAMHATANAAMDRDVREVRAMGYLQGWVEDIGPPRGATHEPTERAWTRRRFPRMPRRKSVA